MLDVRRIFPPYKTSYVLVATSRTGSAFRERKPNSSAARYVPREIVNRSRQAMLNRPFIRLWNAHAAAISSSTNALDRSLMEDAPQLASPGARARNRSCAALRMSWTSAIDRADAEEKYRDPRVDLTTFFVDAVAFGFRTRKVPSSP